MRRPQILFFGLALLVALRTAAAPANYDPRDPPEGVFQDEWTEIYINGQKVGFGHQVLRRQGDRVLTEYREEYKLRRAQDVSEMSSSLFTEETLGGEGRAFRSAARMSNEPEIVTGHGDGKVFDVAIQSGSYRKEQRITFPAGALMVWGQERDTRLRGLAEGTQYDLQTYDPSDDPLSALTTRVTIGAKEKIFLRRREVEATRVTMRRSAKAGDAAIESTLWIDADFHVLKQSMELGALKLESLAATEKQALENYEPADVFTTSIIELDSPPPANATEVVLRLQRPAGKTLMRPPDSRDSHSALLPDGSARITLDRPGGASSSSAPAATLDTSRYLASNAYLNLKDPLLLRLAKDNGGPADAPPPETAEKLRDFVSHYITEKNLSVGFATAAEAAETRRGDCTEHAVLLAALGRIRGLPARVVCGLVYTPSYEGRRNVLVFHMWTQFYLDGQWIDYDSALNDSREPVYWRIGLSASDLDDVSMSDFSLEMMAWMDDLKVTVESTKAPDSAKAARP